jgi:hypothetical protein
MLRISLGEKNSDLHTDVDSTVPERRASGGDVHIGRRTSSDLDVVRDAAIAGLCEEENLFTALVDDSQALCTGGRGNGGSDESGREHGRHLGRDKLDGAELRVCAGVWDVDLQVGRM